MVDFNLTRGTFVTRRTQEPGRRPGRPPKFGRPSQFVALTLPVDVVRGLGAIHPDIARAVVTLFEGSPNRQTSQPPQPDSELIAIAGRRYLIVINSSVIRNLPGVSIVPLHGTRAFLALDPGRGVTDLELAVIDRLEAPAEPRERRALEELRRQLKVWRHDPALRFHTRGIIVVETLPRARSRREPAASPSAKPAARRPRKPELVA